MTLGDVKDYASAYAKNLVREPEKPGGGQYDSWSGTEGDMRWAHGDRDTHKDALRANGKEYGRQYIVCRYQKAYPQYIIRYKVH